MDLTYPVKKFEIYPEKLLSLGRYVTRSDCVWVEPSSKSGGGGVGWEQEKTAGRPVSGRAAVGLLGRWSRDGGVVTGLAKAQEADWPALVPHWIWGAPTVTPRLLP